jgi:hypothetical protein
MNKKFEKLFLSSKFPVEDKLRTFSKYVSRKYLSRFLVQHELFKMQLEIKGSIVECGVHQGGGLLTWAKLSSIYEPYNYHRKVIGFDTFGGFPNINEIKDKSRFAYKKNFFEKVDVIKDLKNVIKNFDSERPISKKIKIEIVKGDAIKTIPQYLKKNSHLLISLLYLDFDIYDPTIVAIDNLIKRIPKGGIIAFDELNNPDWPGETEAVLEKLNIKKYKICNFSYEPNISYIVL